MGRGSRVAGRTNVAGTGGAPAATDQPAAGGAETLCGRRNRGNLWPRHTHPPPPLKQQTVTTGAAVSAAERESAHHRPWAGPGSHQA